MYIKIVQNKLWKHYSINNEKLTISQWMHSPESGPRGSKPDPLSFFPWRLQWELSVFQWGSNPHNPSPRQFLPWSKREMPCLRPPPYRRTVTPMHPPCSRLSRGSSGLLILDVINPDACMDTYFFDCFCPHAKIRGQIPTKVHVWIELSDARHC